MTRPALLVAGLLVLVTTGGCGVLRGPEAGDALQAGTDGARPANASVSLLWYFGYVRRLPAAEHAKEHDAVRQLYANSRSDFNRIRYAILMSVPGVSFNDDARALEALEPLLKNPEAALHAVAYVVSVQIQEQRRGQGLQQKLEALKSLEKSLIERDPGGAGRRR